MMVIEKCTFEGCNTILSASQAVKTMKLLGKALCMEHAAKVSADTSDLAMTPGGKVLALLARRGFEEQSVKGFFILDGPTKVAIDLNKVSEKWTGLPQVGVLQTNGDIVEEGHGIKRIDDLRQEIETCLKQQPQHTQQTQKEQKSMKKEEPISAIEEKIMTKITLPVSTTTTNAIVRPAVSTQEAIAAWKEFNDLKQAIIADTDRQKIGDKLFIKKSGWRKLAAFFNLTDKITEEVQLPHDDDGGWTWKIKVVVIAPNGRVCEGVGICSTSERKFAHIEHDTYATAHTRAKNRAISDMIAGGEVSAEEVE